MQLQILSGVENLSTRTDRAPLWINTNLKFLQDLIEEHVLMLLLLHDEAQK